jgi:hypothetical protein
MLRDAYDDPIQMFELNFGVRVLSIDGRGWRGFVVCGIANALEDELGPLEVSGLVDPEWSYRPFGNPGK